jgi:uncharacterized protein YbjT (DUF2867 family)
MTTGSSIKVILTGATGMLGEGVLYECLQHPQVAEILVITRKPSGFSNPNLKEIFHENFYDLSPIQSQLAGYDACFFCIGITSIGLSKEEYFKITNSLTLSVANTLSALNPNMTFCYTSAAGTDRNGRANWAKVKAKTEDDLMQLAFKDVYSFRPGFIKPTKGLKQIHGFYKYINWLFPLGRAINPKWFVTLEEIGKAMINACLFGYPKKIIEGKDIIELANK